MFVRSVCERKCHQVYPGFYVLLERSVAHLGANLARFVLLFRLGLAEVGASPVLAYYAISLHGVEQAVLGLTVCGAVEG